MAHSCIPLALGLVFSQLGTTLTSDLPHFRAENGAQQFVVHGKPFLILGGELGNSSAGTAAQATDVLSGGPLYAGIGQYTAVCYIFNGGPDSITLKGMTLASVSGAPAQLTHNECGATPATLAPNVACGIAARVSNSIPYTCRYAISPDKVNARGVMEMRDISGVTLRNAELR